MSVQDLTDYEYAHKRFSYDPNTGVLVWKESGPEFFESMASCRAFNSRFSGKESGTNSTSGHRNVLFRGKKRKVHRVAWLMTYGYWPKFIDHINGNPSDNRIENLRDVERSENHRNFPKRKDNRSGCPGVSWYKNRSAWLVRINHEGKEVNLGYYDDLDEAISVRKRAEIEYGYHENHGR